MPKKFAALERYALSRTPAATSWSPVVPRGGIDEALTECRLVIAYETCSIAPLLSHAVFQKDCSTTC